MRLLSLLSTTTLLLILLPSALSTPAPAPPATPAATTALHRRVTPTPSPTFPQQTPQINFYQGQDCQWDGAKGGPGSGDRLEESGGTGVVTEFEPKPSGREVVRRWYVVTYCSCVTFSNNYVHCGIHEPVRPGVGPDGSSFGEGGRKEVWVVGMLVGVVVAVVGGIVV